jgi:hypothetical protein
MIRTLFIAFLIGVAIHFYGCNEMELTQPEIIPIDTVGILDGSDYFVKFTFGNKVFKFESSSESVSNGVFKEVISSCQDPFYDSTRFTSYFARASSNSRDEIISFGLVHCVPKNATGYNDSTYVIGEFPMENSQWDTVFTESPRGFISFLDSDSVLWSSSLALNGFGAQKTHSFEVTLVKPNYDIYAVLDVEGTFSGWVYNQSGDSILVKDGSFFSRAWSF